MRAFVTAITMAAVFGLAGCGGDGKLMTIENSGDGPDEFAILPTKPLAMPADLAALPAPTPGGANITDPTPVADAVASLGGNPALLASQGVGGADGALVAHTGRLGREGNIRSVTAAEDEAFRSRHGRRPLEILARTNVYMRAYLPMTTNPYEENERFRRAGSRTPSAPPAPLK